MDVDGIMESSKGGGMSFGVATREVNELGTEYGTEYRVGTRRTTDWSVSAHTCSPGQSLVLH